MSEALAELQVGMREVQALRAHPPRMTQKTVHNHALAAAQIAHRRACVVLLSSHYERYLYAVNEKAVDHINDVAPGSEALPLAMRLLQVKSAIDDLGARQWDGREDLLISFVQNHASLWRSGDNVTRLSASPNLAWMKSPKVPDVIRFFKIYGVDDVFAKVTRSDAGRRRIVRSLQGLVDARNGIAHGDQTVQPVGSQITEYMGSVRDFCSRADRILGRHLTRTLGSNNPW